MLELLIKSSTAPERVVQVLDPVVVIAGFTGRDPAAVQAHIRELAEIGVPEPPSVPSFYAVPNWTLTQSESAIQVATDRGSGEAEPVLVAMPDGTMYLTVGSDHTDRDLERVSIELAKRTQPKVVGRTAWPLADIERDWDELLLRSWVGEGADLYQEGPLATLLPPLEVLEKIRSSLKPRPDRPLVAFLGTVPLQDGSFRFDRTFTAAIYDVEGERRLVCNYAVEPINDGREGATS